MALPYRARVDERWFLNLPGFHGGAYVVAYVEDTSKRDLERYGDDDGERYSYNFEPRMILELADCKRRINLEFDVDSEAGRENSLHKLDTLITALRIFREGFVAEFEPYDRRQGELDELERERELEPDSCRRSTRSPAPCLRSSEDRAAGFEPARQRFDSSRGLSLEDMTPWPSGEARACKACTGRFDSAGCLCHKEK